MHKPKDGFTIIEVIIVLAIAGIIMGLIFGAIPAFTRNSRNSQRKQDVAAVLDAISHFELNNSGNMPQQGVDNYLQYTKPSYYVDPGSITVGSGKNLPVISGSTNLNTVTAYNYQKCDVNTPGGSTRTGAGYNDIVAIYAIETAGGSAPKCQQL